MVSHDDSTYFRINRKKKERRKDRRIMGSPIEKNKNLVKQAVLKHFHLNSSKELIYYIFNNILNPLILRNLTIIFIINSDL